MPVERWGTWNGIQAPFDNWDALRLGRRPRAFYSQIDNLFLRSAAALEWIIARLEGTSYPSGKPSDPDTARPGLPSSRHKRGGRPVGTDPVADRRIVEAWATGTYRSYEDCAIALGKETLEVSRAIDRHRHRDGKTKSQKSSQEH